MKDIELVNCDIFTLVPPVWCLVPPVFSSPTTPNSLELSTFSSWWKARTGGSCFFYSNIPNIYGSSNTPQERSWLVKGCSEDNTVSKLNDGKWCKEKEREDTED